MTFRSWQARQWPDDSFPGFPIERGLPKEDENNLGEANVELPDTELERSSAPLSLTLDYSRCNGGILNILLAVSCLPQSQYPRRAA
jgi:hypothetical protein